MRWLLADYIHPCCGNTMMDERPWTRNPETHYWYVEFTWSGGHTAYTMTDYNGWWYLMYEMQPMEFLYKGERQKHPWVRSVNEFFIRRNGRQIRAWRRRG